MINRRHIRIKVMQSIYALLLSNSDDLLKEEKFIYNSIDKLFDLYVLKLQLLVEVKNMEKNYIHLSRKKHLATPQELKPNKKFIDNQVIKIIEESVDLKNYLNAHKLNNWQVDQEFVTEIWKQIKKNAAYKNYMQSEENSFKEDQEFLITIFKEVVAPNEKLADYFEDKAISWVDDIPFVNTWIVKTLNNVSENKPLWIGKLYKNDDDRRFVKNLFTKVALHHHTFEKEIENKTPNWDKDRIAEIDMLLIKMAMTEFLHFPSIPTRVTINEYIEISKDYSTTKSSFFINGVLDKVLKDFTEQKKINKIGRGLM